MQPDPIRAFPVCACWFRPTIARTTRTACSSSSVRQGNWCIDASRIAFVGHSDGGTLAQVVALQPPSTGTLRPGAIVASGAGLLESDFGTLDCPASRDLDELILHGRNERHFPDYGASATRAWARCHGCAPDPVTDADDSRTGDDLMRGPAGS